LRDHDYAAGGTYFVTICTEERACLFGDVRDGEMRLNEIGLITEREWVRADEIRPEVEIDVFGLMPNHLHGLISINPPDERGVAQGTGDPEGDVAADNRAHSGVPLRRRPLLMDGQHPSLPRRRARSLSSIVGQFKATSTRAINDLRGTPCARVWQRGFYEHVVQDGDDFARIVEYIVTNPERWESDDGNQHR